jgi:hypothetical protein
MVPARLRSPRGSGFVRNLLRWMDEGNGDEAQRALTRLVPRLPLPQTALPITHKCGRGAQALEGEGEVHEAAEAGPDRLDAGLSVTLSPQEAA